MYGIALLLLLAFSADGRDLKTVLKSSRQTLKLYNSLKLQQHLSFNANEDKAHFKLFRQNANDIVKYNESPGGSETYDVNKFTLESKEEKKSHLGLNVTGFDRGPEDTRLVKRSNPSKIMWTTSGYVTAVKDQGGCGSCWAFGSVVPVETRYKLLTGKLKSFAEQEYLDCVYEDEGVLYRGCDGGFMSYCYEYSVINGGRLATTSYHPYTGDDVRCVKRRDGMIAAKITGYQKVAISDNAHEAAIAEGGVTVVFEATDRFFSYKSGVIKDTTCTGWPNHAVAMVGYTPEYYVVKNSWGAGWGLSGYVKFPKTFNLCSLFDWSYYPVLARKDGQDTDDEASASTYDPEAEPVVIDWCQDRGNCGNADCSRKDVKYNCWRTCQVCCPRGTIRCPNGQCKHKHMC